MTTAPPASRLQAAQSGAEISRTVCVFWNGSALRTAFSTASDSTPKRQKYAPIAKKNDRHIAGFLDLPAARRSANADYTRGPGQGMAIARIWLGCRAASFGNIGERQLLAK